MDAKKIIEEIEKLPTEGKEEVFSYVNTKMKKKEYILSVLNKFKGSGKGVWNMDAQEYINQLRADDRN